MRPAKPGRPAVRKPVPVDPPPTFNQSKVSVLDLPVDAGSADAAVLAFPEPAGRRQKRNWIIAGVALVLLVAGLLAYLVFSPALALRTITVEGNTLVKTGDVTAALEPLMGTSLSQITDDEVAELLAGFAPIEEVSIAAVPPSTLGVRITERPPVAILQSGRRFLLIDAEGRQLAAVKDRGSVKLPLIDGGTGAVNTEVFSSITTVLAALPADILKRLNNASADSVDSVKLSLSDGKTVFWGSADGNEGKASVLQSLLSQPPSDPPVKVVDVSTPTRPVTR